MKIGGKKFVLVYKPIAHYESSIGCLEIFSISFAHNQKLLASIGTDLSSCDPVRFIKSLLLYICYPVDALGEEQTKPDEIALSSEDIDKLTDEEVNQIAELYVEHEPYLYRKQISKTKTGEDGESVLSLEYGDIEHPRKKGENSVRYLHRLYVIQEEKQKEEMERFCSSLKTAHFSPRAFKGISNTTLMGNSIVKAVEAMRFPGINDSLARAIESMKGTLASNSVSKASESMNKWCPSKSVFANINAGATQQVKPIDDMTVDPFSELAENAAKARREPFEFLAERLDKLIGVSSDSATFMVEVNKTQTVIASEIKASGEHASRLSKLNIGLTISVIVLTIVSLAFVWQNSRQDSRDAQALHQYADGIRSDLKNVADGLSSNGESADKRLKTILDELMRERANENNRLNKIMVEQLKNVERLKQQQAADRQTIERLLARIFELEKRVNNPGRNAPPSGEK